MYVCPPQSHRFHLTCKSYFFSNGTERKWQRIEIQEKVIKSGFVPFRICYTTLKQFKTRTQRDERKVLRLMGFTLQDLQYPGSNEVFCTSRLSCDSGLLFHHSWASQLLVTECKTVWQKNKPRLIWTEADTPAGRWRDCVLVSFLTSR